MSKKGPWIACPEAPALTRTLQHGDRLTWVCTLFGHWLHWRKSSEAGILLGSCWICRHSRYTQYVVPLIKTPGIDFDTLD
jgi:hypothetical protein